MIHGFIMHYVLVIGKLYTHRLLIMLYYPSNIQLISTSYQKLFVCS